MLTVTVYTFCTMGTVVEWHNRNPMVDLLIHVLVITAQRKSSNYYYRYYNYM